MSGTFIIQFPEESNRSFDWRDTKLNKCTEVSCLFLFKFSNCPDEFFVRVELSLVNKTVTPFSQHFCPPTVLHYHNLMHFEISNENTSLLQKIVMHFSSLLISQSYAYYIHVPPYIWYRYTCVKKTLEIFFVQNAT